MDAFKQNETIDPEFAYSRASFADKGPLLRSLDIIGCCCKRIPGQDDRYVLLNLVSFQRGGIGPVYAVCYPVGGLSWPVM